MFVGSYPGRVVLVSVQMLTFHTSIRTCEYSSAGITLAVSKWIDKNAIRICLNVLWKVEVGAMSSMFPDLINHRSAIIMVQTD